MLEFRSTRDEFEAAVRAGQDRERQKNEGQAYANDVIPKARGMAARLNEEAEGHKARVMEQAEKIYDTCLNILAFADSEKMSSQEAAIRLAEKRISEVGRLHMTR